MGALSPAKVDGNTVTGNTYGPATSGNDTTATGVLPYNLDGDVEISNNNVGGNDIGIDVATATNLLVQDNQTNGNRFDGLRAESDAVRNVFAGNTSTGNHEFDCFEGSTISRPQNKWQDDTGNTQNRPGLCRPNNDRAQG